jgi:predicted HD phosphohydrolase
MSWMITATGAEYHLHGPGAMTDAGRPVRIDDIAHQLAIINRFHGATSRPYSVAEHSLLVSEIAQRHGMSSIIQLAALLHDAHEIYTQDLSSPGKAAVNSISAQSGGTSAWTLFEHEHARQLRKHFGVVTAFTSHRYALRYFDLLALATERRDLTAWQADAHRDWPVLTDSAGQHVKALGWLELNTPEREAMTWRDWRQQFQDRFDEIGIAMGVDLREGSAS